MVEVEERAAEEEQRRDDQIGDEDGHPNRVVRLLAEQERERDAGEDEDDHERRQRAEGVDVVGTAQLDGAVQRRPGGRVLDHHHGHDQPDEREPCDREDREPGEEDGGGQEGERAEQDRAKPR